MTYVWNIFTKRVIKVGGKAFDNYPHLSTEPHFKTKEEAKEYGSEEKVQLKKAKAVVKRMSKRLK